MNAKKLISAYTYALFIILMVFALLSAYPIFLIAHLWSKKPRIYFQKIVQQYFRLFYKMMPLMGKISVYNRENINAFEACIYVSSHQSSIDYTLLATLIDDYVTPSNHFISDYFLFMKIPRDALGVYYIPKGNLTEVESGYKKFAKALTLGSSVIIFPEGTRNPTSTLKKFKGGAFRLAIAQNVPVVPIIINGTGNIVSKGSNITKTLEKKEVSITFLEPIYPKSDERFLSFGNRVRKLMQSHVDKNIQKIKI